LIKEASQSYFFYQPKNTKFDYEHIGSTPWIGSTGKSGKAVLEALQINFEQEIYETEYLMSSPAMVARIEQGEKDIQAGKGVKADPNNLCCNVVIPMQEEPSSNELLV